MTARIWKPAGGETTWRFPMIYKGMSLIHQVLVDRPITKQKEARRPITWLLLKHQPQAPSLVQYHLGIDRSVYGDMLPAGATCMVAWGSKQAKADSSVPMPSELSGVQKPWNVYICDLRVSALDQMAGPW